ncbi:15781_t:CDS:2 [Funneliformis geosporum]|uniref:15781_t:CDS:1 n=1 Tax=Funneliformis geosporum TaxID=1117311 RepID=A0A9W4SX92_9GLOM|nr:15781_t:CDS:2 [Funneliformis geosporum]
MSNSTDNIKNLIDKLFTLLTKIRDKSFSFDETKDILNKCITFSTRSNGLAFIHKQNIIHQDFHSGNIFCKNEYDIIISDLKISKISTESSVDENECYGIIPYMAPEIFQEQKYKKYTKASDLYSFGMIM